MYVWANSAGTNYGTSTNLLGDTTNTQTYLRFNLHGIPAGARLTSVMRQAVVYYYRPV